MQVTTKTEMIERVLREFDHVRGHEKTEQEAIEWTAAKLHMSTEQVRDIVSLYAEAA